MIRQIGFPFSLYEIEYSPANRTSYNDLDDRPFYEEEKIILLSEHIVSESEGVNTSVFAGYASVTVVVDDEICVGTVSQSDDTYTVSFTMEDGNTYEIMHNVPIAGLEGSTLEVYVGGGVVPLDEKYMPLLTSPDGTQYKLTVANDGTLSAVAVE